MVFVLEKPFLSTVLLLYLHSHQLVLISSTHLLTQSSKPQVSHALTKTSTSTTMRWCWQKTSSKTPPTTTSDNQLTSSLSVTATLKQTATSIRNNQLLNISFTINNATPSSNPPTLIWGCCKCRSKNEYNRSLLSRSTKCQRVYTYKERLRQLHRKEEVRHICDHLGPCDDCMWCIETEDPEYVQEIARFHLYWDMGERRMGV